MKFNNKNKVPLNLDLQLTLEETNRSNSQSFFV